MTNLWTKLRANVSDIDSSRQLAAGVTLGMMIGLLPKDSLLAWVMILVLILSRANLLSAICAVVACSWLAIALTPLTHAIGFFVLTFDPLEPLWAKLIQLPVVPWTQFDNSVVMGALILGWACAVPVYRNSKRFFDTYGFIIFQKIRNFVVVRWLVGSVKPTDTTKKTDTVAPQLHRGQA